MAFKTKSLSDLVRVCENELSIQFYGESSVLRKSVLKVLAAVLGGALYMMSLLAVRIWRDRFVSTCGDDALDGFGTEYGIPHKAPLYARGNVLVSLSGNSPRTLSQGVALVDEGTGLEYEVSADTEISGENVEVPVVATAYGANSNLENGAELSFRDGTPDGLLIRFPSLLSFLLTRITSSLLPPQNRILRSLIFEWQVLEVASSRANLEKYL